MRRSPPALAVLPVLAFLAGASPAVAEDRGASVAFGPGTWVGADEPLGRRARAVEPDDPPAIRARAVEGGVRVDGVLDEGVWREAVAATGFVQSEPLEGEPATERSEVRVAYDRDHLYVAARLLWTGPGAPVVNDLRRDFEPGDQDSFEVLLDTFHDRRNGYVFVVSAAGARTEYQVSNEGYEVNINWDVPWRAESGRADGAWTVEIAIPFSAIRFDPARASTWGINFARRIRRKNEVDFWAPVPRSQGLYKVSLAGDLEGLPTLEPGRDLRIIPYVVGSTTREVGTVDFDETGEIGGDLKYGITESLALDITANPDFAQVEVDEQRVNLTQFPLLFPEKRGFFLENSGTFYLGDDTRREGIGLRPRYDNDLIPFYSRRIGLTGNGRPVPITGGMRLTGRAGGFDVGALGIRTEGEDALPTSHYGVVRLKRGIFSGSEVGGIVMTRVAEEGGGDDHNLVYGADANVRLPGAIDLSAFVLGTETPGLSGGEYAYRATLTRRGNFFHIKTGVLELGENYHSDLSFYRRTGARKWILDTGLRPRFPSLREYGIREIHPHVVWNYYEDLEGRMVAKRLHSGITLFLSDGGHSQLAANPTFQRIDGPLTLHRDVDPIPAGRYSWNEWKLDFTSDPSRPLSVLAAYTWGGLWSGSQRSVEGDFTVRPSGHLRASVGFQRTAADLDLPDARFTTWLWTARVNYSFSTELFVDALLQYDDEQDLLNANVRFNLIHAPLSDVFLVYNERQFVGVDGTPPGRSLALKVTRMFGL